MFEEKIKELKDEISEELSGKINSNYVLLNLPYYANIGDILIWQGTESYLSAKVPFQCLYKSSINTHNWSKSIDDTTTILMQGGGNFGDLWSGHQSFRLDIIQAHPNNPILIFPVSVHYTDEANLIRDAKLMSQHQNLTICVRDVASYELLTKFFSNTILLVPDMAFWIEPQSLDRYLLPTTRDVLLMKRNDKELASGYDYLDRIENKGIIDTLDWPTKQQGNYLHKIINRPLHRKSPFKSFADYYAYNVYRPYLIKEGVRFLSTYRYIYTTRLHGAILCILLGKQFTFFDNSYGKNKGFYDAWLTGTDGIVFEFGN